jgi:DMSO/TMAO reductase YedYZ molybdopterin-dependent catalytic subunit
MADELFAKLGRDVATDRRTFIGAVAAGTVLLFGGVKYVLADAERMRRLANEKRPDGRPRLPPSQYPLEQLRPMGGTEGDATPSSFRLEVHGEVDKPFTIDLAELLRMPQVEQTCDVHCVTKWTVLDAQFTGVRLADLAARAGVKRSARFVIFEAPGGYTSNIDLAEAMKPNVLVAHRYDGRPLARRNGAPVRALVPDRYFWKSAKWLTGIRFAAEDHPGYWEVRGYDNHADPWLEERYG